MRLIDADTLIDDLRARKEYYASFGFNHKILAGLNDAIARIDEQPTIERKTGMWLRAEFGVECNLCKRTQITMTPYCSHCGAEMDC